MFNDSDDDICEVLKGRQLKETQDKFIVLSSPNVCNLAAFFKHRPSGRYINNILELKFKSRYIHLGMLLPRPNIWLEGLFFQDVHR